MLCLQNMKRAGPPTGGKKPVKRRDNLLLGRGDPSNIVKRSLYWIGVEEQAWPPPAPKYSLKFVHSHANTWKHMQHATSRNGRLSGRNWEREKVNVRPFVVEKRTWSPPAPSYSLKISANACKQSLHERTSLWGENMKLNCENKQTWKLKAENMKTCIVTWLVSQTLCISFETLEKSWKNRIYSKL